MRRGESGEGLFYSCQTRLIHQYRTKTQSATQYNNVHRDNIQSCSYSLHFRFLICSCLWWLCYYLITSSLLTRTPPKAKIFLTKTHPHLYTNQTTCGCVSVCVCVLSECMCVLESLVPSILIVYNSTMHDSFNVERERARHFITL